MFYHHLLSQVSLPLVLLSWNQWCTPPLRLQVSDCIPFLLMCDVPSAAASCRESTECSSGIVYRYIFSPSVTISDPIDYRYDKAFHIRIR
jgi:hypothetical protein